MTTLNFNAGPAVLPPEVLAQAQAELRDYAGTGMSVMEMSHRSREFEAVMSEAQALLLELLGLDSSYEALLLQGGASLQFAMLPMNFLPQGKTADYLMTGAWSDKALEEAGKIGTARAAGSSKAGGYRSTLAPGEYTFSEQPAYVHLTTNETIQGVQWQTLPDTGDAPLVADMSSDILSRPLDHQRFSMIYAGAQKNLGPSGVTVVVLRKDWLAQARSDAPAILRYATHAKNGSMYNTPATFGVYVLLLTLRWLKALGGAAGIAARNERKATLIYDAIDRSGGFYTGHAAANSRSRMNVTFRLPSEELEKQFVAESLNDGMVGLAGHRSVGGIRASIYNALGEEACTILAQFMAEFQRRNG